ncbi:MAG: CoA transferase [Dehalococcoidia bacterium]|nr:CoA transferase [Dehalococcoidia bacterium]MCB9485248.1 CoA transferase [Thermoflexaceae bacterium]
MPAPEMPPSALDGYRILDITQGVAGPYCTKLLADYGAEVIKVEPPSGDRGRREGPFANDDPSAGEGALFLYLNTNKKSVTLDIAEPSGAAVLRRLAASSHLLISDWRPADLAALGLDYESLRTANPKLAMLSLSYYGESGPYAGWVANNLTSFATGGQMAMTGDADREPLKPGGYQADYQLGLNGFSAATVALFDLEMHGEGQYCEVANIEAMASTLEASLSTAAYTGTNLWRGRRGNIMSSLIGIYPAADGYIGVHAMPRNWKALVETMGQPELAEDPRFSTAQARLQNEDDLRATLYAWSVGQNKREVYQRAGSLRGPVAYVHDMEDLFTSPHVRDRGYLVEVDHPDAGTLTYPRGPFTMSETPWIAGRAPLLGEHTVEVLTTLAGLSEDDIAVLHGAGIV